MADFSVTTSRSEVISFSYSITEGFYKLFIRNVDVSNDYGAYFEPFNSGLWYMIGSFCIVASLSLYLTVRYYYFLYTKERKVDFVVVSRAGTINDSIIAIRFKITLLMNHELTIQFYFESKINNNASKLRYSSQF